MGLSMAKAGTCQLSAKAILLEIARPHGYSAEDLLAKSRKPELDRLRREAFYAIHVRKGWGVNRIATFTGRNKSVISRLLKQAEKNAKSVAEAKQHPEYIIELKAQLDRLSGYDLAPTVAHRLGLPMWQAIFLSILMETYPRVLTTTKICELYEEAANELIRRDESASVDVEMLTQFRSRIRKTFEKEGLPSPVVNIKPFMVALSDDIAPWLHHQFGRPLSLPARLGRVA